MSDWNSRSSDVDALVTSGDERPLSSLTEIERGTEGVWTPASLATHDTLPGHVNFWKRFRRNKVAVAAAVYLVLLIVAAVLAGRIGLQDPNLQHLAEINKKPSGAHWFGQDDLGRDVFARVIYGARISLKVSFLAIGLALIVAVPLGLLAGFVGGWVDQSLMRISDAIQVIPALVLALVISGILGPSATNVALALAFVFTPGFVRLVRGQVISVREETYVEASRSIGAKTGFIIRKRVLHNVASPLIVQAAVTAGFALLAEATLSFLGLGAQLPAASWGVMLSRAYAQVYQAGWLLWIPGGAIAITVLAFNLVGDGLRDALGAGLAPMSGDAPAGAPLLEVTDLSVSFTGHKETVTVVDHVSFSVRAGETLGIVGESGSGKTVSSLALVGLLPRNSTVTGSARFGGRELIGMSTRQLRDVRGNDISVIFQEPMTSLDPSFTVGNQLMEAYRNHKGGSKAAARERALEMLRLVGIPEPQKRIAEYPHSFSGGMRQRVMIALALICSPRLLIADEPTTALDVTIQSQILELLRRLQVELGMAIIFVTHDLGVVASVCDQVSEMYAGQVVEQAPVDDFFAAPRHPYSVGLLDSMPQSVAKGERLRMIAGTVPQPSRFPVGCRFAPRCPHVLEECTTAPPVLERLSDGRRVRCIRHADLAAEITR